MSARAPAAPGSGCRTPAAGTLATVCAAYFMVILDTTVVSLALPSLGRGLHATTTGLEWVVDAYSLVFAALLLSAGALADRRGAKPVFQAGVGLFAASSLACALSPTAFALAVARAAQGLGAAMAVPASLALLQAAYPDQAARRRAFGVWGGVAGIAAGAGPVAGGAIVSTLGWRSVFLLNVPVGIAALLFGRRHLAATSRRDHGADPTGQLAGVTALGALTAALIEAGQVGWTSPVVVTCFVVFVVAGGLFAAAEHRCRAPMLPLALFASPAFSAAAAVGLLINLGFYGELFVMSLFLQQARHFGVFLTGVALLPQMAMAVIGSTASGRAMARRGTRPVMVAGLLTGFAGLAGLAVVANDPYWAMAAPLVATGFGMSFTMPAATAAVMEAVPPERGGVSSAAISAARQAGGVVGVALLGTLAATRAHFAVGVHAAIAVAAIAFLIGALLAAVAMPGPAAPTVLREATLSPPRR